MNIAIVGFDREGKASFEFLQKQGHTITICDQNDQITVPNGVATQLGSGYLEGLEAYDWIVRTPGLHPAKILHVNPSVTDKITSQTNLFFEHCPTKNIIGVTGTKGKGTTSTLISKMLEADGKHVVLAGNIGIPMLSQIDNITKETWVVLELSSFQLIDLRHSPQIATVLMVSPEHLDWHEDFEEYVAAKQQLFIHQEPSDVAIYYANNEDSISIADASEGIQIPYFAEPGAYIDDDVIKINGTSVCSVADLALRGRHNWQNVCAAITTTWQVTQNVEAIRKVAGSFTGLAHRLELIRDFEGVQYFDDSFGTTPQTAQVAIEAFAQPKIIIIGGSDKGTSFDELVATICNSNVKHVIQIGTMGPVISKKLSAKGYTTISPGGATMTGIVAAARAHASPGDVVLLSTGCASFDMFKNYKDRGDQFKQVVNRLS